MPLIEHRRRSALLTRTLRWFRSAHAFVKCGYAKSSFNSQFHSKRLALCSNSSSLYYDWIADVYCCLQEFRKSHLERTSRCAALKRVIKYIEGGMSGVQALQSALLLTTGTKQ